MYVIRDFGALGWEFSLGLGFRVSLASCVFFPNGLFKQSLFGNGFVQELRDK